jgi:hypothetical protein
MVTQLPAETPGWKLAALKTPPLEIAGGGAGPAEAGVSVYLAV